MTTDPRLSHVPLLVLAAMRARQRRQTDWRQTEGLWSLLQAAKALPQRGPWDLPTLEETSGLAGLLAEARQWQKEGEHGA